MKPPRRLLISVGIASIAIAVGLACLVARSSLALDRYFMPGPLGHCAATIRLHASNNSSPGSGAQHATAFVTRAIGMRTDEEQQWAKRNGLTTALPFSHHLADVIPPELYPQHPEFFPYVDGGRLRPPPGTAHWNPDLGREDVARHAASEAAAVFVAHPDAVSFSLGINDALVFGESPETLALVTPQTWFRGRPDYSRLVFTFMNRAAVELAKTHPDRYLGCLAYYWAENVPPFSVDPHVIPFLTADRAQSYDRTFEREEFELQEKWAGAQHQPIKTDDLTTKRHEDPNPFSQEKTENGQGTGARRQESTDPKQQNGRAQDQRQGTKDEGLGSALMALRLAFQQSSRPFSPLSSVKTDRSERITDNASPPQIAPRLGLYDYLDGLGFLVPRVPIHAFAEHIKHARAVGFTDYYGESSRNWGLDGPLPWVIAQLLQHPDHNVDALLDEYYASYFKSAADPMRRFFERCEQQWMRQSGQAYWLKYYRSQSQADLFPPEVCRELRALLNEAQQVLTTKNTKGHEGANWFLQEGTEGAKNGQETGARRQEATDPKQQNERAQDQRRETKDEGLGSALMGRRLAFQQSSPPFSPLSPLTPVQKSQSASDASGKTQSKLFLQEETEGTEEKRMQWIKDRDRSPLPLLPPVQIDLVRDHIRFVSDSFGVTERFVAFQTARANLASKTLRDQATATDLEQYLQRRSEFIRYAHDVTARWPLAFYPINYDDWLRDDPMFAAAFTLQTNIERRPSNTERAKASDRFLQEETEGTERKGAEPIGARARSPLSSLPPVKKNPSGSMFSDGTQSKQGLQEETEKTEEKRSEWIRDRALDRSPSPLSSLPPVPKGTSSSDSGETEANRFLQEKAERTEHKPSLSSIQISLVSLAGASERIRAAVALATAKELGRDILPSGNLDGPLQRGRRIAGLQYGIDLPAPWKSQVEPTQFGVAELRVTRARGEGRAESTTNYTEPKTADAEIRVVHFSGQETATMYQWLRAKPGALYAASVQTRGRVTSSDAVTLTLGWLDAQQKPIGKPIVMRLPDGNWPDWVTLRQGGYAPANAAWVGIGVRVQHQIASENDFADFARFKLCEIESRETLK